MRLNKNYINLKDIYLFENISSKVKLYIEKNPNAKIIKLGIGDVTQPIPRLVAKEMSKASLEMSTYEHFKGYGDYNGYEFFRDAIKKYYLKKGIKIKTKEIFINDGAKSDLANILNIFEKNQKVLIQNPVYPVYLDANIMIGNNIVFANGYLENNFLPMPDYRQKVDLIYICSPNNPTGAVYSKDDLKAWVEYAMKNSAIILFDSAYEAFVKDNNLPTSIFEIDGANECAIEFCSLSKTAGFTGIRCGYTIIPENLKIQNKSINDIWYRDRSTKTNGVSYIVQRAGAVVFENAFDKCKKNIKYYMKNASIISKTLKKMGIWFVGGINSPYIWLKCVNMNSWDFFDYLLQNANIVGTPGVGFGSCGEGFFRLTAFAKREDVNDAMQRFSVLKF